MIRENILRTSFHRRNESIDADKRHDPMKTSCHRQLKKATTKEPDNQIGMVQYDTTYPLFFIANSTYGTAYRMASLAVSHSRHN